MVLILLTVQVSYRLLSLENKQIQRPTSIRNTFYLTNSGFEASIQFSDGWSSWFQWHWMLLLCFKQFCSVLVLTFFFIIWIHWPSHKCICSMDMCRKNEEEEGLTLPMPFGVWDCLEKADVQLWRRVNIWSCFTSYLCVALLE